MHVVSGQVLEQWATLTDEQVVGHVLTGQTALFEILMRRYNERLYRVARAIVRDDSEAEDVMQQADENCRQRVPCPRPSAWSPAGPTPCRSPGGRGSATPGDRPGT